MSFLPPFHNSSDGPDQPHEPRKRRFGTPACERMVRYHEQWLTRILTNRQPMPRIPVKKVEEGGFAILMAEPGGRTKAGNWWDSTLKRVP